MIYLIFFLLIFLPYLNRDKCDTPGIGYTCNDLEEGVDKLKKLLERERDFTVSFNTFTKQHPNQILLRLYTIALALATDSTPIIALQSIDKSFLNAGKNKKKIPFINLPHFAQPVNKVKRNIFFPICFNQTKLTDNLFFQSEMPPIIKPFLLNPSIHRLTKYLGPAAYHILLHFSLNITSDIFESLKSSEIFENESKIFGVLPPMPLDVNCINELPDFKNISVIQLKEPYDIQFLLSMMNVEHFGFQIGDLDGVIVTLLRGIPSFIYDPVSNSCYKGRSIISGTLNPLYSGIHRSSSDFARTEGEFCHDQEITKNLFKQLL